MGQQRLDDRPRVDRAGSVPAGHERIADRIPASGATTSNPTTSAPTAAPTDHVVSTIGSTRAVVVVEPDALWFVDRQTPPGTTAYTERMATLTYVVDSFARSAPRSDLYLEAGTSSKSLTPTQPQR